MITDHVTPKAVKIQEIADATAKDETLSKILTAIKTNKWQKDIKPYYNIRHDI